MVTLFEFPWFVHNTKKIQLSLTSGLILILFLCPQVLSSFKKLHRTRQDVFAGDEKALIAARIKINEEYRKNKDCEDAEKVQEMIKFAESVETELRCTVVQAVQAEDGTYGKLNYSPTCPPINTLSFHSRGHIQKGRAAIRQCPL